MLSLRFEGVYYAARVWLNGVYLGDHEGYFSAFEFDVTDIVVADGENDLLVEVVKDQPTFDLYDVSGSLVGFRFPDYAQGLNVSGYHFHFITADRSVGGHVLGCTLVRGELSIDHEGDLRLEVPPDVGLPTPDQSAAKGEALDRIERE